MHFCTHTHHELNDSSIHYKGQFMSDEVQEVSDIPPEEPGAPDKPSRPSLPGEPVAPSLPGSPGKEQEELQSASASPLRRRSVVLKMARYATLKLFFPMRMLHSSATTDLRTWSGKIKYASQYFDPVIYKTRSINYISIRSYNC